MRTAQIKRKTTETDIQLSLNIDGTGKSEISTGCGFLDHMLTLFARHGRFDLNIKCMGDSEVDFHHTVEDVGICLGQAFLEALGSMAGIERYGNMLLPMDEALVLCALDISGRAHLEYGLKLPARQVGAFDSELVSEFFFGFSRNLKLTLHLKQLDGSNTHHIIEAAFKAFARALSAACKVNEKYKDEIPSTKGVLV